MINDIPLTRDLVFVGGGHAHALVLRAWGMKPLPGARLTLVNPGPTAPYTGMLPGHIAGHYDRAALDIDLVKLSRHAGARFIEDYATGVDRETRSIMLASGRRLSYDVASIDVGITAEMGIEGFHDHGIGAKPLDRYAARWRDFLSRVIAREVPPEVAVIGGGVAGCELAMAMAFAMKAEGVAPRVTVIAAGPDITGMGYKARLTIKRAMHNLGIDVRTAARVVAVEPAQVVIAGEAPVPAQLCVGAAGAFPHTWIAQTDLPLIDGFIEVDRYLAVQGDEHLFAVGDCAVMPHAPRPKAGVFAVRAAPILHQNLRAALAGGPRRGFAPQRDYLKLISLGDKSALAEKFGVALSGRFMWRWKDRIDQAFMSRLRELPKMPLPTPERHQVALGVAAAQAGPPLCGGCGAKVDQTVLGDMIGDLSLPEGEVVTGVGDDAAVLRQLGGGYQVISTDHLRAFDADPMRMARIAAVHALGDIWAMGARPQVALSNIILPMMSPALQRRTLADITAGLMHIFRQAHVQLVGGHTTLGAELTIGLTVTGTCESPPITLGGAKAGDVLLLTRPIGSGVILAAEMQGQAAGEDVSAALSQMVKPQINAARCLLEAHAMTDVTGFGLAGHVQALVLASSLDTELRLDDIPLYAGARALSDAGIASSLMPANRKGTPIEGINDPLLFDPQTAGGLLAALPLERAQSIRASLQEAGEDAFIIGRLMSGTGRVLVV